jgi:hypothetical protein
LVLKQTRRWGPVVIARERLGDTLLSGCSPASSARSALRRVSSEAWPFSGGGNSTPARRAFDKPIAMACRAWAGAIFGLAMNLPLPRNARPPSAVATLTSSRPN